MYWWLLSFYGYRVIARPPEDLSAIPAPCSVLVYVNSTCFCHSIFSCDISWPISCLCSWAPELKIYPELGVKRKFRTVSLTAGKYFGCSSYHLNLGPLSSWSNMSTFIKCFRGASMAKTVVGKWFRLHWGHLDRRLLQMELLRRVSSSLNIFLHMNSWTLYNKILNDFKLINASAAKRL